MNRTFWRGGRVCLPMSCDTDSMKRRDVAWHIVRVFVALVLLIAASLKFRQLVSVHAVGHSLFDNPSIIFALVEFEFAFGIWLLFNLVPRQTRLFAIALFTVFGLFSLSKAFLGEESCGCFGTVRVDPRFTAILDAFIVLGLIISRSSHTREEGAAGKLVFFFLIWTCLSLTLTTVRLLVPRPKTSPLMIDISSKDHSYERSIAYNSTQWKNEIVPLLQYIEPADAREYINSGDRTVVFYRHNCKVCHKVITELCNEKRENVVFVEIPPFGETNLIPPPFKQARFISEKDIFFETPVIIYIEK